MNIYVVEFLMWLIAGIVTLIAGPIRLTYVLCWLDLLVNILEKVFRGDTNE
jgi:hypothetical protein